MGARERERERDGKRERGVSRIGIEGERAEKDRVREGGSERGREGEWDREEKRQPLSGNATIKRSTVHIKPRFNLIKGSFLL